MLYLEIQQAIRARYAQLAKQLFGLEVSEPALDLPPNPEMGDLSLAACFELAKNVRRPPRQIAEQLAQRFLPLEGIERATVAGAGYLNFSLDRSALASALYRQRTETAETPLGEAAATGSREKPGGSGTRPLPYQNQRKILIEHTSINPNKAAHIGHLRNAVLGDTFVRLRRFRGDRVEIQNYIDNTGVQVADVVVSFLHVEKKSFAEVEALIRDPAVRFDYLCWDLYARVFQLYEKDSQARDWRTEVLKAIEAGQGEAARLAELVASAIVRLHLATMQRVNVRYDLLVQESDILRLDFWKYAFELLKKKGAIRLETSGKNAGCWVMSLPEDSDDAATDAEDEDVKIIVRSNGTVTYVGKDIAYHLWKFGLLGKDFGYEPFHRYADGATVWRTTARDGGRASDTQATVPAFGGAAVAYAVIDTRQSYVQNIVLAAFRALGYRNQAANLHHFAYEVVGLSRRCAEELGFKPDEDDGRKGFVEVSGRKGLGMKADDLMDALEKKALEEVRARQMLTDAAEQESCARRIAVGALRYFMLKFSRRMIITFDLKDALAFEGETGPYLQYSVVRAQNIRRKFEEADPKSPSRTPGGLMKLVSTEELKRFLTGSGGTEFWDLVSLAAQLEVVVEQAVSSSEPAAVAKFAFRLAQAFNNFYHRHHILTEPDPARQRFLLFLVLLIEATLARTLDTLGIEVPERM